FERLRVAAEDFANHIHEAPVWIGPLPRRRDTDPDLRFVHLSSSSEHAAGSTSARPRRDTDDAVLELREGSGGRIRVAARRALLCAADRLSDGSVWASPPYPAGRCRLRSSMGPAVPRVGNWSLLRPRNVLNLGWQG